MFCFNDDRKQTHVYEMGKVLLCNAYIGATSRSDVHCSALIRPN